jgi:hypothetical protein
MYSTIQVIDPINHHRRKKTAWHTIRSGNELSPPFCIVRCPAPLVRGTRRPDEEVIYEPLLPLRNRPKRDAVELRYVVVDRSVAHARISGARQAKGP